MKERDNNSFEIKFENNDCVDKGNKYLHNGKELIYQAGMDCYDYGARHYDPSLGRWHVIDPLAEKLYGFTPYNYCYNNPLVFVDPDGRYGSSIGTAAEGGLNQYFGDFSNHPNIGNSDWLNPRGGSGDQSFDFQRRTPYKSNSSDGDPEDPPEKSKSKNQNSGNNKVMVITIQDGKIINSEMVSKDEIPGLPKINGTTAPWSEKTINETTDDILQFLDATNQSIGHMVSIAGVGMTQIKFLDQAGKVTFWAGLSISALRTDWDNTQSVTEFGIGTSLSIWAYKVPWAIPFAFTYSSLTIDKEYSKTLPKRAATGFRMSREQYNNHPYFKKK